MQRRILLPSKTKKLLLVVPVAVFTFMVFISVATAQEAISPDEETTFWLWHFLGRLHPMVVHFPIAFLIFAAILEIFTFKKFDSKFRPAIQLLVWIGAVSAVMAAGFGWLLADSDGIEGELLDLHQQVGIATAILSLLVLFFLQKISKEQKSKQILVYRSFLFIAAVGVSVTGHFGASLTHGEDFLTEILPFNGSSEQPEESISSRINLTAYQAELNPETEMKLIGEVRMVLAHNCYKCHSGAKIEGELRLDEKEFVFAGGESGKILVPGDPSNSEMIRRINLRKGHKDVMPSKGKLLTDSEKQLLELWISKGAPWPDGAAQQSIYRVAELAPRKPVLPRATAGMSNPIDLWVNEYFKENNLDWQAKIDDRTYLRRIFLDVIGLVPTAEEFLAFSQDTRPEKRTIWLQNLLNRNDDYAVHWMTFWNDALRNDYTGTGYITNGRFNITDWLYTSIRDNKPYDQFVKQLLSPNEKSKGFIEGIRWRGTVNASQRTEVQAAQNVAQVILGLNLKCASCHDSFISDWKLEEAYAFANIFADSTLEVSRCEQPTGTLAKTKILWEELGDIDSAANRAEKLRQLADRLVIFQIASSNSYQSQSVSIESADKLIADDFQFKGLIRRRMTAEQFSDAVSQMIYPLFDSKEMKYKPYELLAEGVKKTSFARASLVANNSFLTALGRPNREIVSTSRDSQASLLQALELTNGERLNTALKNGAEKWKAIYPNPDQMTQQLYQKALHRKPSLKELEIAKMALGKNPSSAQIQDFFWAVLLLPEFQMVY